MSAGDAFITKSGLYTDIGIDLDKDGMEWWPEIGTELTPASGTALTISGNYCCVRGMLVVNPAVGQIGIFVSGNGCYLAYPRVMDGGKGLSVTGSGCIFDDIACGYQTNTAFDIDGAEARFLRCYTVGAGGSTYGFKIGASKDTGVLRDCTSCLHGAAGYYVGAGASEWTFANCISGHGDGKRVDLGSNNMWSNFADHLESEHHEHVYPFSDGKVALAPL